ncbi:uncharacterized protein EI90DRAFT_3084972 [Cantharellus anzutake]|uniref:uncharacterized protein n=1 Tax=Cantharellus anzutake TaxID=1750568 RepID=UPI001902EF08|nr:uncharacterized protein EI90DRAFT_3084972 [Cantharellus anzutake]KAF8317783.1 hypothetical protein EI90DRAFT_3084972 [Cantharellus anzutake]
MKEAIFKSAILVGVPHVIEASFALKVATEGTPDYDTSFVREGLDDCSHTGNVNENQQRGLRGLERVYRAQYGPISSKMAESMAEIKWMSEHITYGLFLEPVSESNPRAPLTFAETEMVVLSCLIAQRSKREVLWHLRGALRSGLSSDEVEAVQSAVELVATEIAGIDLKTGMPRVVEVTEEDDLSGL